MTIAIVVYEGSMPVVYRMLTNLILSEDYLNLLNEDPQDVRHCVTEVSAIANNEGLPEGARDKKVYLAKFPGKTGDPRDNNLCIVRLSEIYLIPEGRWFQALQRE